MNDDKYISEPLPPVDPPTMTADINHNMVIIIAPTHHHVFILDVFLLECLFLDASSFLAHLVKNNMNHTIVITIKNINHPVIYLSSSLSLDVVFGVFI